MAQGINKYGMESKNKIFINNNDCMAKYGQSTLYNTSDKWPLLLTWFNFNPSMDK